MAIYVLDSCVFVQAYRQYYPFDLVPTFWQRLVELAQQRRICSIDRVKSELLRMQDELSRWASQEFSPWFETTDREDVIRAYREVMEWAHGHPQYRDAAKEEFAQVADGWLVAYAKTCGGIVVSNEQPSPQAQKKIKLPDACRAFDIEVVGTFDMLRRLQAPLT